MEQITKHYIIDGKDYEVIFYRDVDWDLSKFDWSKSWNHSYIYVAPGKEIGS